MRAKRIAIVGLGLIGGSLGLAFKNMGGEKVIVIGIDHDQSTLQKAIERGAVDHSTNDLAEGVKYADIIFLCTPVLQIVPIVEKMLPYLKVGAILTDVGSTKSFLAEKLSAILPAGIHYVSGHPMTGREQSGIMAAEVDLFRDKWYILVPEASTCSEAVDEISQVLKWTGARLTTMDIAAHDQCAAIISHVPHVAAAALVNLLELYPDLEDNFKLVGGGFRDTTRIASSNADMWADICLTNAQTITDSLLNLQALLDEVIQGIKKGDRQAIHYFFKRAKVRRDALIAKTDSHAIV
ncbi:MAG: Prephenate dehydrogenase [Firmicutes bacterium]|nr:Prephenate dehydrogenase [Bacillota bacterium]